MSGANSKAVFLSYASQDAEAARSICEALRAAGVEVWFDQSELRGGDAWDAKIRKQIKECALFVPVISASTQARQEGYFRLEWRLADQRTHLMSHDRAFLLPVTIDATTEQGARVPESFLAVQWTPIRDETGVTRFAARVQSVLRGAAEPALAGDKPPVGGVAGSSGRIAQRGRRWPVWATLSALLVGAVALAFLQPWRRSPSAPVSEARRLVLQARALIDDDLMAVRENFRTAEELCQKAVALENADGEAWATLARVSCGFIHRSYDTSPQRMAAARAQAQRALQLAPTSIEARLAMGEYFAVTDSFAEAERRLRDLLQREPHDRRVAFALASVLGNLGRAEEATQIRLHHPAFGGRDPRPLISEALKLRREGRLVEAEAMVDRAQAIAPTPEGYRYKLVILGLEGDNLPAATAYLQTVPAAVFLEDAFASRAAQVYLRAEDGAKALEVLRRIPRELFEERGQNQPRGYLAGWALSVGGKYAAAEAEWRAALAAVEKRLAVDLNNTRWLYWKAMLLAQLGQREEAEKTHRLEVELRGIPASHYSNASLLVALQKNDEAIRAVESLREEQRRTTALQMVYGLRRDPWFASIRDDPRVQEVIAELGRAPATVASDGGVASRAPEKSVAVLAFRQLSADPENEYLCEAISDELCSVLGRVPRLKVAASASSFVFKKDKRLRPSEMAAQLGVAYLVDGTVLKSGNRVRVRAELIKAEDETPVWRSDDLVHELKDVMALQDAVVPAIARNLQLQLGTAAPAVGVANAEAFRLYYEGRRAWSLRATAEYVAKAEDLFRRAIAADNKLGRAYSGLADVLRTVWTAEGDGLRFSDRDSDRMKELMALAETALRWEPQSAEAYTTRGGNLWQAWRVAEAERDLRKAIQLNPSYADAHLVLGRVLAVDGRIAEAVAELKIATELDPLSSRVADNYAGALREAGRYAEALVEVERAVAMQPGSTQALRTKMNVLSELGRHEEALAIWKSGVFFGEEFRAVVAFMRAGQATEAARIFDASPPRRGGSVTQLAALGRYEEALNTLRPELAAMNSVTALYYYSLLDPIRSDARFVAYLRALGIKDAHDRAQAWRAAHPPQKPATKK